MGFARELFLMGIVILLVTGTAAAVPVGIAVNRTVNPAMAGMLLTTTAPSFISCPQGYVCTIPADVQGKNYVIANDTRPCGNLQGLPAYCYRPPLSTGPTAPTAAGVDGPARPGSRASRGSAMWPARQDSTAASTPAWTWVLTRRTAGNAGAPAQPSRPAVMGNALIRPPTPGTAVCAA